MPTNLPPEYYEAEKVYKEASTPQEKVAALEELLSTIPKHKGTDHLRADLRRRLAKLKESAEVARKKGGGAAAAYHIDREGAGQVVLIGLANTGKSALVQALTNAEPEVSPAPFSTWEPTPGMMPVENIQVQLIDTPPLQSEYVDPELVNLLRRADLLLIVVDVVTYPVQQLEETLEILASHRIIPAEMHTGEPERRFTYPPAMVLVNKCDTDEDEETFHIFCELLDTPLRCLPVSAETGRNFDGFKQAVMARLGVIRVYARPPGREPDFTAPFVLKQGSTVLDFARKVHKEFSQNLSAARVWGSSQFDGQMVQRDYQLEDGDIVELRK
ncbi:MAG: TGS domain-containing protein [Anaerolineales bacterium]|jgi:ribosome-interacting GTPase 1